MPIWSPVGLVLVLVALVTTQQARTQQLSRGQRAFRGVDAEGTGATTGEAAVTRFRQRAEAELATCMANETPQARAARLKGEENRKAKVAAERAEREQVVPPFTRLGLTPYPNLRRH
jgi:hypothetical protein